MEPLASQVEKEQPRWDAAFEELLDGTDVNTATCSLKDLQFAHPYLLNPGSCPGCPETVITRMLTTLFGPRLVIASAVGCCLVWGHFNQFRPYLTDVAGRGPAVATSAFEDNALFGYGLALAATTHRENLLNFV